MLYLKYILDTFIFLSFPATNQTLNQIHLGKKAVSGPLTTFSSIKSWRGLFSSIVELPGIFNFFPLGLVFDAVKCAFYVCGDQILLWLIVIYDISIVPLKLSLLSKLEL